MSTRPSDETPKRGFGQVGESVSVGDFQNEMTIEWTEEDEALIREARHQTPERIAFLASLGYSVQDWEAALAEENRGRCKPFLHGGPYVMVRAFYTLCHGGKYKDDPESYVEVHHMPAKQAMKNAGMNLKIWEDAGPSVALTRRDHTRTLSFGSKIESRHSAKLQAQLIISGQFKRAVERDIDELRTKFGVKYEVGIQQMQVYVDILESINVIK